MTVWGLSNIRKRFGQHEAVRGVDLDVRPGERVGIIGESGSGKTTLCRVGLGLLPPDEGEISLFGEDTSAWSRTRWTAVRKRVQLLFQDPRAMLNPALPIGLTLEESALIHRPEEDPGVAVSEILDAVGLAGRGHSRPSELSGGEVRRAGLARTLLARPELLVADEPTAGLDASLKAGLLQLIRDRLGVQCSFVLISHDLPMVAWATDRMIVMYEGQIVDTFKSAELRGRPLVGRHPHTLSLLKAAGYT